MQTKEEILKGKLSKITNPIIGIITCSMGAAYGVGINFGWLIIGSIILFALYCFWLSFVEDDIINTFNSVNDSHITDNSQMD